MNIYLYRISLIIYSRSIPILLLSLLISSVGVAQKANGRRLMMFGQSAGLANDTVYLDIDQDIAVQLLPFDELVKIAVTNSPLIKYQNEIANSLNSSYQGTKAQILQNVGGSASYSAGNQSIVSSGALITSRDPIGQIANGYRVGVDMRVSLYDLFGRKHQIRQAYSNYRAAVIQKETVEQQLKRELIVLYQDMITSQQILKLRLVDEQASLAAYRIAEVETQKGKITADLLASATSRYIETKTITEQVKGEFLKNVHIFETLMGAPIQRLKRN
ncbi:TolC family protein [Spirosoma agri]|uniref:TolC family protein n=1 Tax=Spirosoma agri TaxID=1987381 RepID=A0A6M0IQW1_9BACT|nr:TolC family protein [Spirosoma agri]NEU70454.1 TolC family protein [Spirosoma agri]